MSDIKFVMITGRARSGKDTFAALLAQALDSKYENRQVLILPLAGPLHSAVYGFFNYDSNLGLWTDVLGDSKERSVVCNTSPRELMQEFGAYCRSKNPDFFCHMLEENVLAGAFEDEVIVIVPDCRYDNEFEFFSKSYDTTLIKVESSKAAPIREHHSENGLSGLHNPLVVGNDGTLADLALEADLIAHAYNRPEDVF